MGKKNTSSQIRPVLTLTLIVGGVIDAKVAVPDDGQLHGKAAHLHPVVEVLSPRQPRGGVEGKE